MALTQQQETEVITRLEAGEGPAQIIQGMNIVRLDFMDFQKANRRNVAIARRSKAARLARLNRTKTSLEGMKANIERKLEEVEASIAQVEAE